jgi:capsular exopolysaccharide synthesis family protein
MQPPQHRFYDAMARAFTDSSESDDGYFEDPALTERDPEGELEQLERVAGTPPGALPEVETQPPRLRLVESDEERHGKPIPASYERIIQGLLSFRGGRRHCVVMVASAIPGEGASTVSRELAESLAHSQDGRVVLVDANMRTPSQADAFGIELEAGFPEALGGSVKPLNAVFHVPGTRLSILATGVPDKNPSQLMSAPVLHRTVTSLYSKFDWVIFDAPPVTRYPDASTLAAVCDGAILVLRAEQTRWEVAEEARKTLDQAGVSILGGVLNRRKYHIPDFIYRRL